MRRRTVAWAGAAAMVVGAAGAWLGADAARANDMADHPDDVPDDVADTADDGFGDCPELADLDPSYVALGIPELRDRVRAALPVPPSMAEDHLEGLESALGAVGAERRDCMRKILLIRTVATFEHLNRRGGRTWYHAHPSRALRDHFLTGPLTVMLSSDERRDVVAFVDARIIPALDSDGEADREYWRRVYFGGLLACHGEATMLEQLGGQPTDDGCLDVAAIAESSRSVRGATGVIDPWTTDPLNARP